MPFVSKAQQRYAHTAEGQKKFGGPAVVKEFDTATTNYDKLPERKGKKPGAMAALFREVVAEKFK